MDIVLVHGSTQSSAGFDGLAQALRLRRHHVVVVDLPTDEATWTAGQFAEFVAQHHASQVEEPVVVAHSASGVLLPSISATLGARPHARPGAGYLLLVPRLRPCRSEGGPGHSACL